MSNYDPYENVPVKHKTKQRLDNFGKKGETYDGLLNRLMDNIEEVPPT